MQQPLDKWVERCQSEDEFNKSLKAQKLENQAYAWLNDQIICQCCNKAVAVARKM